VKPRRLLAAASAALAASLALAACKAKEAGAPPAGKSELPVEQTPVSSIYDEKPGTLYERPARTTTPTSAPAPARTAPPTR
jgi:hypothetical protein